jgi:hypothetical protein
MRTVYENTFLQIVHDLVKSENPNILNFVLFPKGHGTHGTHGRALIAQFENSIRDRMILILHYIYN